MNACLHCQLSNPKSPPGQYLTLQEAQNQVLRSKQSTPHTGTGPSTCLGQARSWDKPALGTSPHSSLKKAQNQFLRSKQSTPAHSSLQKAQNQFLRSKQSNPHTTPAHSSPQGAQNEFLYKQSNTHKHSPRVLHSPTLEISSMPWRGFPNPWMWSRQATPMLPQQQNQVSKHCC